MAALKNRQRVRENGGPASTSPLVTYQCWECGSLLRCAPKLEMADRNAKWSIQIKMLMHTITERFVCTSAFQGLPPSLEELSNGNIRLVKSKRCYSPVNRTLSAISRAPSLDNPQSSWFKLFDWVARFSYSIQLLDLVARSSQNSKAAKESGKPSTTENARSGDPILRKDSRLPHIHKLYLGS